MDCPKCGYHFDDHTCVTEKKIKPVNGDISICLNCGAVHEFRDGALKDIDIETLPADIRQLIDKTHDARRKVLGI